MFTTEDILARLRNGEDAQAIANQIADHLNDAVKAYEDEEAKKREVQMKKDAQEAELDEIAETIADAIMDYMCVQDPSLTDVFAKDPIEPSYVRQALDVSQPIMGLLKSFSGPVEKDRNSKVVEKVYTGDEAKRIITDNIKLRYRLLPYIYSEVGYLELGEKDIGMFLIPGELFPELYNGEFLTMENSATRTDAHYKILKKQSDAKHTFVLGLCNDELGYIIPDNDFLLDAKLPYINGAHDHMDRNHYEETNSTGIKTARILLDAMDNLIKSVK
jgi:hypothetical protein